MEPVEKRFLRYVSYETTSDESSETCPSTEKQKALGKTIVEEMLAMDVFPPTLIAINLFLEKCEL